MSDMPMLWGKRPFDLLVFGLGLLGAFPPWTLMALRIKLEDGGSVFYAQEGVGKGESWFRGWKFRSMVSDSDDRMRGSVPFRRDMGTHA